MKFYFIPFKIHEIQKSALINVKSITDKFWEQPISLWDDMFDVGLRSHYVASKFAVPLLLEQNSGLIVNIPFFTGRRYISNVAYGVCKAAVDRLTHDMSHELKDDGIASVSLYLGMVRTEGVIRNKDIFDLSNSESPMFIGRAPDSFAKKIEITN